MEQRSTKTRRRKLKPAAKRAYIRAATIGCLLLFVLVAGVTGVTRLLTQAAPLPAGDSSTAPSTQGGAQFVDAVAGSTVKPLSGTALTEELTTRIEPLLTALVDEKIASLSPQATTGSGAGTPVTTTPAVPVKFDPNTVGGSGYGNISSWKAINSDVRGWLRVPNTNINYPVVVGPDNLYYNELGYYKEKSLNGVIWADSDTRFGNRSQVSQNNVIYGHNWTNYSASPRIGNSSDIMFAQLTAFHHLNFAKVTPYIHYSTESEEMLWKVFAVFYTEDSFNYIVSDPGATGLSTIINEAKLRSLHKFDVDVTSSDKILTLSTCTRAFGATSEQRFVVMARLMRSGETITEVGIEANPGYKRPKL